MFAGGEVDDLSGQGQQGQAGECRLRALERVAESSCRADHLDADQLARDANRPVRERLTQSLGLGLVLEFARSWRLVG
jgi:hypothetical protein